MKMGIYQATYGQFQLARPSLPYTNHHSGTGVGALVAPLVATQFSEMQKWSYFFFISLGLALVNIITIYMSFGSERIESQFFLLSSCCRISGDI